MSTRRSRIEMEREEEERRRQRLRRRREEKRRRQKRKVILLRIVLLCVFAAIILSIVFGVRSCNRKIAAAKTLETQHTELMKSLKDISSDPMECARALAARYDYDTALKVLTTTTDYQSNAEMVAAVQEYQAAKQTLVSVDVMTVEQLTFHSLIVDENHAAAMAGNDATVAAANQNTMSVTAFNQYLQQLYDQGYVLVRMSDIATFTEDADGSKKMKKGEILLPEGKKPLVLSQEDVTYSATLAGAGYGTRMILGEDGTPVTEYKLGDGSVASGDYDVVPCLDTFIEQHPDFSYRGARGILALKGADGFLGYRTEEEKNSAKTLIEALKDEGWEFASNGYGDVSYASTFDQFQADVDSWQEQTGKWLGDVNILLYPYGVDIGSWTDYGSDDQKYTYLKEKGFCYFSNEDEQNAHLIQIRDDYVRQIRKNASTSS
ncbi:MAG: polysaccharide deacetylase [Lachnospiraceae bacterium]|nr:polysaccharide deacetylase [Lachnospiraceae bacterium]